MKILITGARGMLATQIINDLTRGYSELAEIPDSMKNAEIIKTDVENLDITNQQICIDFFKENTPDICINCAAFTNVDGCEQNAKEAFRVNAMGARNLAIACESVKAKLVHISTDYVFSGEGDVPFCEYDIAAPQSVYGKTKLMGEEYVKQFSRRYFIIRTAWLYGYYGKNFVKTIKALAEKNGEIKVVNDQIGNPTNAADLSHHIIAVAATNEWGIYHCTNQGECSWFDFAKEIISKSNIDARVIPCTTQEFPRPAKRPAYSSLENAMLTLTVGNNMRSWQDAIKAYFIHEDNKE